MQAIIFDVDGTLVDSVDLHAEAWKIALARFGHEVSFSKLRHQIGKGGDQLLPVFLSRREIKERADEIGDFRDRLFRKQFLPRVQPFPQVRALFQALRKVGWKIAIASSSNKKDLNVLLDRCQVRDLLDVVISADDAEKSKPHPDIFLAAKKGLHAKPAECVAVGDSPYDAQAAGQAKIACLGVLSGGFSRTSLKRAGAANVYRDPADLLAALKRGALKREDGRIFNR
jgi:HAD superfamily hydrolase (TIGR01509 family)